MELELSNITKNFKQHCAVNHISLNLHEGVYGLLGANGAGKTTLMRMLVTLLDPSEGEIQFNGENIFQLGEIYRNMIGYLPQKFGYYPDFSGYDFLLYIASLKGFKRKDAKRRVMEVLDLVNLMEVRTKKLQTYSGGMIQRLGIAQAIINDPKILILDEPTAGLDPKERIRFRNIISTLSRSRIVILSTHIVSDIECIAQEIFIMKKGSICKSGSIQEILTSIENHVYEIKVSPEQVEEYQNNYCVSTIRNEKDYVLLRIIFKDDQIPMGNCVEATLEDLYISEFQEEVQDK